MVRRETQPVTPSRNAATMISGEDAFPFAMWWPYYLAMLADAYGKADQADAGLSTVADGLVIVNKTQERWYEAELYRLQGELLLEQLPSTHSKAESAFHKAIDIAQQQQAKSWELRAASSLARLWRQQGKTADLKDAKALLSELTEGR